MYCPRCAAKLADTAEQCYACELDVRPLGYMLAQQGNATAENKTDAHWHMFGIAAIVAVVLLGLSGSIVYIGTLITVLAGLIGLISMVGSLYLLASER